MRRFIDEKTSKSQELKFMLNLYDKYGRLMHSIASKCCSDPFECEEIVQDTVLKLIEKVPLLHTLEEKALVTYISVSVRNTAYSHMRKRAKEQAMFIPWTDDIECIPSQDASIEDTLIFLEQKANFVEVWSQLSGEERFLLEGRYILRYTDREMAESLDYKPGTVRMKLTRLRRKILQEMKERDGEGDDQK